MVGDNAKPEDHAAIQRNYAPNKDPEEIRRSREREIEFRKRIADDARDAVNTQRPISGVVTHVKRFENGDMQFGFIRPDNSSLHDIFIHPDEIEPWRTGFKDLETGQKVLFKVDFGRDRDRNVVEDKFRAINVEIVREEHKRGPISNYWK